VETQRQSEGNTEEDATIVVDEEQEFCELAEHDPIPMSETAMGNTPVLRPMTETQIEGPTTMPGSRPSDSTGSQRANWGSPSNLLSFTTVRFSVSTHPNCSVPTPRSVAHPDGRT
jgi:hypothetical protein